MSHETSTLRHFVDQPRSWTLGSPGVIVRGWCFTGDGRVVRGVRLRAGSLIFSGVTGLPRPDVRQAIPDAPNDNTGFEIRATLPPGQVPVILEAQTPAGDWQEFLSIVATVRRPLLPRWLGGGSAADLVAFQMPAHAVYPPRPVRPEKYPAPLASGRHLKFSIVTPSYQQVRFLGEAMRSVLTQAGVECEYLVQDGGSKDGSVDVIRRFAADSQSPMAMPEPGASGRRRGRVPSVPLAWPQLADWSSEPDQGQGDAIIRGFARTSGGPDDLMAWLNSDDFYLPGALAFVADYFGRHPEIDVVYGNRIVVDEESREIARWFLPAHDAAVLRLNDFIPQETLFWRRHLWQKVGGLDSSFQFAMDWDLLLRFQSAGAKIVRLPRFLACFRVHPAQKTSAAIHDVGQREINQLRLRENGREIPPGELERDSRLLTYLRRSAFIEALWRYGVRLP